MTQIKNNINTYADLTAYNADTNKDYPNVSYIEGTDEVKWNKYDPDHIVCVYNVTSTSEATKLLNANTSITYQIIDGVQQQSVQTTYTFDTLGEHTVKYKLSGTNINGTFYGCSNLTSINIPSGVTSIGYGTFNNCSKLTSINIPSSVTSIGGWAFNQCKALTSITIPNSVTSIGDNAFQECSALTSVTIPSSVTSIGYQTFYYCTSLTSITISDSVTTIGNNVFYGCSALTSVIIPSSVTSIGGNVFYFCSSLTSVTIQATTPPTLGNNAVFYNTNNCPIYVPAESVAAYKAATNWSTYADRIQTIPSV